MIKSKKEKLDKEVLKEELKEAELTEAGNSGDDPAAGENDSGKISELEKQVYQYKDMLLRKAAEFENYKKRTETEISNVYRYANEGIITELLPVLDDFTRVRNSWEQNHDAETFKKGIELVYDKFISLLKKQGLKEMDNAVNKPFDVNLHEALMQVPTAGTEPNTVTSVIENGYFLKDKVIRHAKVAVSSPAEEVKKNDE